MDDYIEANRRLWNGWTGFHVESEFYDVAGFKAGRSSLPPLEIAELGDVAGKTLLHLQCHFGQDTLSWARLGATVTGADLADAAIIFARQLAAELDLPATFVRANLYDLPDVLEGTFDIVYVNVGALNWLPDLAPWGRIIAHYLKPGGTFYMREIHPMSQLFEPTTDSTGLDLKYSYFRADEPLRFDVEGSYAGPAPGFQGVEYSWNHSLSEILGALLDAGLQLQFLHEFPFTDFSAQFPGMMQDPSGWWRATGPAAHLPLMYTLQAQKPG
jgi:SAM-dependent methyltransferase